MVHSRYPSRKRKLLCMPANGLLVALFAVGADAAAGKLSTAPELFDEPQFTVAGVTDNNNLGGHGSGMVARNKETLARDAAALKKGTSASPVVTALAAEEKSLRDEVTRQPHSFESNHRLGKLLVDE